MEAVWKKTRMERSLSLFIVPSLEFSRNFLTFLGYFFTYTFAGILPTNSIPLFLSRDVFATSAPFIIKTFEMLLPLSKVSSSSRAYLLPLLLLGQLPLSALSHARWSCPEPRSAETGIKEGPCGGDNGDFSNVLPVEIRPGPMLVTFEESIYHTGAPFRISLSDDGDDDPDRACVLLDHVPHNDDPPSRPRMYDESTYVPYAITVNIPDVRCERCSLYLSNPMTDKIGTAGSPLGVGCTDPDGTCFSVYHSCTRPLKIVGAKPRSNYDCPSLPSDWPVVWVGDNGMEVEASDPGVYRRESSEWGPEDHLLIGVPDRYRQDVGICGSVEAKSVVSTVALGISPTLSPMESSGDDEETVVDVFNNDLLEANDSSKSPNEEALPDAMGKDEFANTLSATSKARPLRGSITFQYLGTFTVAFLINLYITS